MAESTKVTRRQWFEIILAAIPTSSIEDKEGAIDFVNRQIASLDNKKSSSKSKNTEELEARKAVVYDVLSSFDHPVQVKEIVSTIGQLDVFSSQRVTSLLGSLVNDKKVVNIKDKKTSLFAIAEVE